VTIVKTNIVVDASVAAKWFFPDEEFAKDAFRIQQDFLDKTVVLSVPTLIYYEINNILKSAVQSKRVTEKEAIEAYEGFLNLEFAVYSSKDLMKQALAKATEYDISSYDASYVALASYLKIPFFTADRKLLDKVGDKFIFGLESY